MKKKSKKLNDLLEMANQTSEVATKVASMQRAKTANEPDEILKIAISLTTEDYGMLSAVELEKVSDLVKDAKLLKKTALEVPKGLPNEAPPDAGKPKEESPSREEGALPKPKNDPAIDIEGGTLVPQCPGTLPEGTETPIEVSTSDKAAFVHRSLANGINLAKDELIKSAAAKVKKTAASARMSKEAERLVEELIKEHGEEKVAEFLEASAKKGYAAAQQVINGGDNV